MRERERQRERQRDRKRERKWLIYRLVNWWTAQLDRLVDRYIDGQLFWWTGQLVDRQRGRQIAIQPGRLKNNKASRPDVTNMHLCSKF